MREGYFLELISRLEKKIEKVSESKRQVEQEVVTLRLQVNAFIRTCKLLFPLRWIFKHYMKKENEAYVVAMTEAREELLKLHEKVAQEKKPCVKDPRERIGRNAPCYCGSGKKYKKCCLDNKKILHDRKDIEEAINETAKKLNKVE